MSPEYLAAIYQLAKINFLAVRVIMVPTDKVRIDLMDPVTNVEVYEGDWFDVNDMESLCDEIEIFCENYETPTDTEESEEG